MSPMPQIKRAFAGIVLLFGAASSSDAGILRTADGEELLGELADAVLNVRTESGEVEIPSAAILQMKRVEGGFDFVLEDGTRVLGVVLQSTLRMKVGLVFQEVPVTEIEVLMQTPPGIPPGSLDSAYYPSGLYKGSASVVRCPIRFQFDASTLFQAGKRTTLAAPKPGFFACDSLSIPEMEMSMRRSKQEATINVQGYFRVLESHDKLATLTIELVAGSTVLGKRKLAGIPAEEKKIHRFSLAMRIPNRVMETVDPEDGPIVARVTVEVELD